MYLQNLPPAHPLGRTSCSVLLMHGNKKSRYNRLFFKFIFRYYRAFVTSKIKTTVFQFKPWVKSGLNYFSKSSKALKTLGLRRKWQIVPWQTNNTFIIYLNSFDCRFFLDFSAFLQHFIFFVAGIS